VKAVQELEVEALPADLPHSILVDISKIAIIGESLRVKDLGVGEKVRVTINSETVVATVTAKMTEEEEKALQEKLKLLKMKEVEEIIGRLQGKREYEYKIKYKDSMMEDSLKRSELVELGYTKMVEEFDLKMALEQGNDRKLTKNEIQKHFETFGLEAEHCVHGKIGGLSGGQKMRVTMASATYFKPHVIILDEPSNFLDRNSLSALANAIKDFKGGIVVISHNTDFVEKLCPEKWFIADGKIKVEGGEWMVALEQARIKAEKEAAKKFLELYVSN
jgi:elongation factor 3